jgi:hypothetical protein
MVVKGGIGCDIARVEPVWVACLLEELLGLLRIIRIGLRREGIGKVMRDDTASHFRKA